MGLTDLRGKLEVLKEAAKQWLIYREIRSMRGPRDTNVPCSIPTGVTCEENSLIKYLQEVQLGQELLRGQGFLEDPGRNSFYRKVYSRKQILFAIQIFLLLKVNHGP